MFNNYIKRVSYMSEKRQQEALDFLYNILYNYTYYKLYKELLT